MTSSKKLTYEQRGKLEHVQDKFWQDPGSNFLPVLEIVRKSLSVYMIWGFYTLYFPPHVLAHIRSTTRNSWEKKQKQKIEQVSWHEYVQLLTYQLESTL